MAGWQYKTIEIVGAVLVRRQSSAAVWKDEGHRPRKVQLFEVEGWQVVGLPGLHDSIDDILTAFGRTGWQLAGGVEADVASFADSLDGFRFRAFFKAPA